MFKLIILTIISCGLIGNATAAPKELSDRMLNLIQVNNNWVADVKQPGVGLKLFDTCFDGEYFHSITDTKATRCEETVWKADVLDWEKLFGNKKVLTQSEYKNISSFLKEYYSPTCKKWGEYAPISSINRTKQKAVNCRWVKAEDHPTQYDGDEPKKLVRLCDYITVPTTFPLTQTIKVYQMKEHNNGNSIYYHPSHSDKVSPGAFRYKYTIPYCQELDEDDIPEDKKN